MATAARAPEIELLLQLLDHAYDKKAWHGPNLRGAIRRLAAAEASWRPQVRRRSIADIVVHAAYWKYAVRRRLRGDKRGSFPLKGSNWFVRPLERRDQAWRHDLVLLDREHARLRETVTSLRPASLSFTPASSKVSNLALICGIANHDVYHAGQIQLLKRLQRG